MTALTMGDVKKRLDLLTLQNIRKETEQIITNDELFRIAKKNEFLHGMNPDGSDIGEYSTRSEIGREYALFKASLNPLANGKVDLILTGSTINRTRMKSLGGGVFTIESADPKWGGLMEKYGEQIGGLMDDTWTGLQRLVYAVELNKRFQDITRIF